MENHLKCHEKYIQIKKFFPSFFAFYIDLSLYFTSRSLHLELKAPTELWDRISGSANMAQRKSPSYPEWPVDRSVYSLFCGPSSASRLGGGVGPRELRSLPVSSLVGFRESPPHFPYLSGCSEEASDLARLFPWRVPAGDNTAQKINFLW